MVITHSPIEFTYNTTSSGVNTVEVTTETTLSNIEQRNAIATSFDLDGSGLMDFTIHARTPSYRDKFYLFLDVQDDVGNVYVPYKVEVGIFETLFPATWLDSGGSLTPGQGVVVVQNSGYSDVNFRVMGSHFYNGLAPEYTKTWEAPTYINEASCNDPYALEQRIPQEYLSGDFNGDGLTDVLAIGKSYSYNNCYTVLSSPGEPCGLDPLLNSGTDTKVTDTIAESEQQIGKIAETQIGLNSECCQCDTQTRNISRVNFINLDRNLTTNFVDPVGYLSPYLKSTDQLFTGDVNGDGKTDIIRFSSGEVNVYSLDDNHDLQELFSRNDSYINTDFPVMLGDYNGDGKTDFMIPTADNSSFFATFLSTGSTFNKITSDQFFTYKKTSFDGTDGVGTMYGYNLVPTDINGDGKTDIIDYRTTTYNNSSSGSQSIRTYINSYSTSTYALPRFVYGTYSQQSGNLQHYPIAIFLNSEKHNHNLQFASISDNKVTAFEFLKDNRKDMLLKSITNNGVTKSIIYNTLSGDEYGPENSKIYRRAFDETYPYADLSHAPGLKVVTQLQRSGSGFITIKKDFSYYGATVNFEGLGFMGFKGFSTTNWHSGTTDRIFNVTKYDPHLRGAMTMHYSTTTYADFISSPTGYISKTTNQYNPNPLLSNKVYKLQLGSSSTQNLLTGTVTNKTFNYDSYNNPVKITTISGYGQKTVDIAYQNSLSGTEYFIGRPTSKVIITILDGESFTTEEQYIYNNYLLTQKKTSGNGTGFITEDFTYDAFGNITGKTITPPGEAPRSVSYEYDSSGRFLIKETDIEGLETNYLYNPNSGTISKKTDPFGFETYYDYDSWYRLTKITDYLGNAIHTSYDISSNITTISTIADDGSSKISIYDALGRLVHVKEKDVLGQWVEKKYQYDALDRLIRESEPFIGSASQWNEKEYDRYGRIIRLTSYTGKTRTISYNGLIKTVNDGIKTEIITKDAWGNIIKKEDPGGTINYTYFGNGNLKSADYEGVLMTIEQDGWGRKTRLTDPSAGTYTYEYNGFGELTKETTPKGETIYNYSSTGRLLSKTIKGQNTNMAMTYSYNSNTKLLTGIDLMNTNGKTWNYLYTYDSFHRPVSVEENTPYAKFTKLYTYNALGQVATEESIAQALSSGKSSSKKIRNTYQNGGLLQITDFSTNQVLWQIDELNARGQSLSATLGNMVKANTYDNFGYLTEIKSLKETSGSPVEIMKLTFDFDAQRGNLNSRTNSLFNWNETFTYDSLDRLTGFDDNNGPNSHTYDTRGRITYNSQIGNYGYLGSSFRQISLNLNTPGAAYYNDLDTQNITYNAFSSPVDIVEQGKDKVSFEYNAFLGRSSMFYDGLQNDKTQRRYSKHYSHDGSMEFTYDSQSNTTTFVIYIGGTAYNAPVIWHSEQGSSTSNNYYYLHRDYLGSILAISDENGNFKEKRHFDAWGNIVKLEDGNGNALSSFKILDRGYTGHEHLLGVGIIHMNGRLYDPVLHRFLSPDNYIQNPFNTQNFNRYGYVLNNPLKYSDPSGEFIIAALIGAAISVIANGIINSIYGEGFFKGAGKAAIFGAIGGAAAFGIGQVAANIASSFAAGAFQVGAHSIVGGTMSAFQGGNFWSGALAGGISSGISSFTRGLLRNVNKVWKAVGIVGSGSVSGGIGSVLGGGNFWNGFSQGAITSGLNHAAHIIQYVNPEKLKARILKDGRLTVREANKWYKHGNGQSLIVNADGVDLDFINPDNWSTGQSKSVQTILKSTSGRVYGNLTLKYVGNNKFLISPDIYDFNMHSGSGFKTWFRNQATKIGRFFAGQGQQFKINFSGLNTVNYNPFVPQFPMGPKF